MLRWVNYSSPANFGRAAVKYLMGEDFYNEFDSLPSEAKKLIMAEGLHDALRQGRERYGMTDTVGKGRASDFVVDTGIFFTPRVLSGSESPSAAADVGKRKVYVPHSFTEGVLSSPRIRQMKRREAEFDKYLSGLPKEEADSVKRKTYKLRKQAIEHPEFDTEGLDTVLNTPSLPDNVRDTMNQTLRNHAVHIYKSDGDIVPDSNSKGRTVYLASTKFMDSLGSAASDAVKKTLDANAGYLSSDVRSDLASKLGDHIEDIGPVTLTWPTTNKSLVLYPETAPIVGVHELGHARDNARHGGEAAMVRDWEQKLFGADPDEEFRANRLARSYMRKFKDLVSPEQYKTMEDIVDMSDESYGSSALTSKLEKDPNISVADAADRLNKAWAAHQRRSQEENARLHINKAGVKSPGSQTYSPLYDDLRQSASVGKLTGLGGALYGGLTGTSAGNRVKRALVGAALGHLGGTGLTLLGKRIYRRMSGKD